MLVTLLSYGVLPLNELGNLRQPSMAGVLESIVGRWGGVFISIGLIVSVLGAYLSWSLLASEIIYTAAQKNSMPRVFTKENKWAVPSSAVWLTNITVQFFLIISMFSNYAFQLALELTSAMTLIPYFFVAAYGLKLVLTRETYGTNTKGYYRNFVISLLATFYALLMIFAGGMKFLLLSAIIYAPGTILYIMAKREQKQRIFTAAERMIFFVILLSALAGLVGIFDGTISI